MQIAVSKTFQGVHLIVKVFSKIFFVGLLPVRVCNSDVTMSWDRGMFTN